MRTPLISARLSSLLPALCAAAMTFLPAGGRAEEQCQGHQLLSKPRPEGSCEKAAPQVFPSPDGGLRALVVPVGVSLYATPDIESRVVIRSQSGDTLASKDYASPRGTNGYYVYRREWSPDSQFFVYSMMSSGGHSPWSFPTWVYSRQQKRIAKLDDMMDGKPALSGDFSIAAPHSLRVQTWNQPGDLENRVTVTLNLAEAFAKLPPAAE